MTIKLYVNWDNKTILSEKQAREEVTKDEDYTITVTSRDIFNEWLCHNYDSVDLFDMDEDKKKAVHAEFMEETEMEAWLNFFHDGYEEISSSGCDEEYCYKFCI